MKLDNAKFLREYRQARDFMPKLIEVVSVISFWKVGFTVFSEIINFTS